eukprot:2957798-Pleurochrysis_carterae.AAC.1
MNKFYPELQRRVLAVRLPVMEQSPLRLNLQLPGTNGKTGWAEFRQMRASAPPESPGSSLVTA